MLVSGLSVGAVRGLILIPMTAKMPFQLYHTGADASCLVACRSIAYCLTAAVSLLSICALLGWCVSIEIV